jgi:hypothetical protein
MSFLYWAYNDSCATPLCNGYIGVSEKPRWRLAYLRLDGTIPKNSRLTVLIERSRKECLEYERQLRPHESIGWNRARGGYASSERRPRRPHDHGRVLLSADRQVPFWGLA